MVDDDDNKYSAKWAQKANEGEPSDVNNGDNYIVLKRSFFLFVFYASSAMTAFCDEFCH